jgi:prepilin-type N-terminal cleavage/methylation domain-containing protein
LEALRGRGEKEAFLRILRKYRAQKGVTLIELAVVMAIVAILGLALAPAIGEWVDNFRIKQAARDLSSDLQLAKMKAIGSGVRYAVVFKQIVGGTTYSYVIFPDNNNNLVLDGGSETTDILKSVLLGRNIIFDPDQGGSDGIDFPNVSDHPAFGFNRSGMPIENSGPLTIQRNIFLKNTKNSKHMKVTVSAAGRIGIDEY